jgi:hypothetical protein
MSIVTVDRWEQSLVVEDCHIIFLDYCIVAVEGSIHPTGKPRSEVGSSDFLNLNHPSHARFTSGQRVWTALLEL